MKTLLLVILASLLYSTMACAQSTEEWDGGYGTRTERRSGFAVGVDWGVALGNANGYPNDALKLNDPRYEADTELAAGGVGRAWVGGAIRDWFTFGLGLEGLSVRGSGLTASGGAFILRPELYPLWTVGGAFRDFGVYADFGIGWMEMKNGLGSAADGGALGRVGLGCFHESLRWKHLGLGPTVGATHYFSQTMTTTLVEIGARFSFTTGP